MNKNNPLVSIIIPIYNVEKYLSECLDSIINQTYKNLEIILVDDGSSDKCGKICDKYAGNDLRIKVIHKVNGGVSSARNAGIDISTGEWIWFCDPDDWVEKDLISDTLNTVLNNGTDMCFFDYERFNEDTSENVSALISNEAIFKNTNDFETFFAYFSGMGSICYFIVKSNIIKDKIKFDETVFFCEDELFKLQLYDKINSFSYLHKIFYHYRVFQNSAVGKILKRTDYPELVLEIYRKLACLIKFGKYPDNAISIPNSKLIKNLNPIVDIAFQNKFSIKCNYEIIEKYMDTDEYKQALLNYDGRDFCRSDKLYAKLKKPNRFFITLIYLLSKVKKKFRQIKERI